MTFSGGGRPEGLRRSGGYELGDSGRQPRARNKGRAREGAVGEVTWAGGARRGGEAGSAMRGAAGAGRGRGGGSRCHFLARDGSAHARRHLGDLHVEPAVGRGLRERPGLTPRPKVTFVTGLVLSCGRAGEAFWTFRWFLGLCRASLVLRVF